MMKLKVSKTYTKRPRTKYRNKKIKTKVEISTIKMAKL